MHSERETPLPPDQRTPGSIPIRLRVNGRERDVDVDPRASLLDVLREQLGLTGAKKGCDHGQCGACTVHLEGRRVVSCLTLAVQADGREVATIEGLARPAASCTPCSRPSSITMLCNAATARRGRSCPRSPASKRVTRTSPDQIREYMSGNLCRCGAYVGIVAAIAGRRSENGEEAERCSPSPTARARNAGRCRARRGAGGRGNALSRRRHHALRSHEAGRRDARHVIDVTGLEELNT